EYKGDDYVKDFLYEMGATLRASLAHEEGIILCHLDNGVFGVIAPERTAEEGIVLAKSLQNAASKVKLPESQELSSGIVAWTLFPDDSDDPKMLRAILTRAFRDLRMGSVDSIARALNVSDATKVSAVQVVETPEDEVVIKRRAKSSSASLGIGSGGVAATKATVAALPKNEEAPIVRKYAPDPMEAPSSTRNSPLAGFSKINIAAKSEASENKIVAPSKKLEAPTRSGGSKGGDFKVVPDLDEDGIDQYTQFCGEEGFISIVDSEMGMDSSLVYVHFANLKALRSKGQESYMKLRKDMAGFIQAYMFDEDDVPGLVGEDDLAVLMTGKEISKAQGFANKVYNVASNMEGVKVALVVVSCKDYSDSKSMLDNIQTKTAEAGVHVIQNRG
ncbi:hypothetical protein IJT10_07775, partial [bacterium]|nr:hypothetical protein [bacterium]